MGGEEEAKKVIHKLNGKRVMEYYTDWMNTVLLMGQGKKSCVKLLLFKKKGM